MNLNDIPLEELSRIVDLFPWFGAARKALAVRTGRPGDAAIYVGNRSILFNCPVTEVKVSADTEAPMQKKVVVVGGDYFSQEQYDNIRSDNSLKFKAPVAEPEKGRDDRSGQEDFENFCTETLAQIYAQQGYTEQAKFIYSKLSLRYPEKSAYFASLIENLKEEN